MKRLVLFIIISFFYLNSPKFNLLAQTTETLTILHVNDTHSTLASLAPRKENLEGTIGGIARAATMIELYKEWEKNVLTLHAGDLFIGDIFFNLFYGVPELQIMKSLGFDAMALGNHEFDLTPEALGGALQTAFAEGGFPLLSANAILEDPAVVPLKNFIQPYTIKNYGKIKVGIFALTTPDANVFSLPAPIVIDDKLSQTAEVMIKKLKAEGCNMIVCLSHLGVYLDQQIAEAVPGIDVIVGGHDHLALKKPIEVNNSIYGKTYIVQADAFYKYLGVMKLELKNEKIKLVNYELLPLDVTVPEEPLIKDQIDQLITGIEQTAGIPFFTKAIGYAVEDFDEVAVVNGKGKWNTAVGGLVTDAFRAAAGTEIGLTTGGLTAQMLCKGMITPVDVFRMIGYGFNTVNGLGYRIATFKISGAELWKGLEICASQVELSDELLAQVSGMSYDFNINKPIGERMIYVEIGGKPIDPLATYTVSANEFVVNAFPMFGVNITDVKVLEDVTEFQVVVNYIMQKQTIVPDKSAIVTAVKKDKETLPTEFKLEQNYPNPFNPSTVISYQLPEAGNVRLRIYNMLGEEVTTLVNHQQPAGTYKVDWNASGLTSGIYLYRLEAKNFVQTKKMILAK